MTLEKFKPGCPSQSGCPVNNDNPMGLIRPCVVVNFNGVNLQLAKKKLQSPYWLTCNLPSAYPAFTGQAYLVEPS